MKAALIDRYGSNEVVRVGHLAVPTMDDADLLVQVHAASVNPVDIKTREGKLKTLLKYRFPLVLGNDLAGVVSDVGSRVTRFKKGDAVYARVDKNRIGTFADFAVVRDGAAALKPTNVTFEEAASLPLVALTAWQALVEIGRLGADQHVLIHAGRRWRWKRGHPVGPSHGRNGFYHRGETQCGTGEASGRERRHRLSQRTF